MKDMLFFNTSGPVNEKEHFCISPIKRLDSRKVYQLILQKKYFLIHGPKQSGKTSYLLTLANYLNRKGQFKCLYLNVESVRGTQENFEESIKNILYELSSRARDAFGDDFLEEIVTTQIEKRGPYHALNELLTLWAKNSSRPIVLLMDEIDTLTGNVLTSVLSQIRAGYDKRPALFPQTIIFCGTHDIIEKLFNVKDTSLRIEYLTQEEVKELILNYINYSKLTINDKAIFKIYEYSNGQPWIVNSIASELFYEMVPYKKISRITEKDVDEAVVNLVEKKGNHLEYIIEKLREPKVKKILIPILMGDMFTDEVYDNDITYLKELGLIKSDKEIEIANGIYKEVIPRVLINPVLYLINFNIEDFLIPNGKLDFNKLLKSYQQFFKNHIERLIKFIDYGNAGYVLIFQSLLQKLVEFGGKIVRNYGLNKNFIEIKYLNEYNNQNILFYIKHYKKSSHETYKQTIQNSIDELSLYLNKIDEDFEEIHLVLFYMDLNYSWDERLFYSKKEKDNLVIHVWGF